MNIKDLVKNKNEAIFDSYRCGIFYYKVKVVIVEGEQGVAGIYDIYQFQIPLEELGNATLNNIEKAITLMRYIRKSKEDGTLIKTETRRIWL